MVEIKEVLTKRDLRKFVDFPNKLYKDNKCGLPNGGPLFLDERWL